MGAHGFRHESADFNETDRGVAIGRYKILKAASPRILFCERFSNGIAALAQRVLTWVRDIFSFPCMRKASQQVHVHVQADNAATASLAITPKTEDAKGMSSPSDEYIAVCNDSIRALQFAFSENSPADFVEGLVRFCECRRQIAAMDSDTYDPKAKAIVAYSNALRILIVPEKEKLAEFLDTLEKILLGKTSAKNPKCDPRHAHAVLSDLLVFSYSTSGSLMSFPTDS